MLHPDTLSQKFKQDGIVGHPQHRPVRQGRLVDPWPGFGIYTTEMKIA